MLRSSGTSSGHLWWRGALAPLLVALGACSDERGCGARSERAEDPETGIVEPFDGGMAPRVITPDGATVFAPPAAEGGPPAACSGRALTFLGVVTDARCRVGARRAQALRAALEADGGAPLRALRQVVAPSDGGRLALSVINEGPSALVLPLSWHRDLPAFTALAEDVPRGEVYELEAPRFAPDERFDAGLTDGASPEAAHGIDASTEPSEIHPTFAQIELLPGASIQGTVVVAPRVARRLRPPCPDGGTCAPARLKAGKYMLHLGELLLDVEAGPPARWPWTAPEVLP